ncbi:MAG: ATP-binding protein [Anaerolineaceae bacterium]|nr:MAG: ATP-binding protein [Anaerolineaceae bacterium]
MTAEQKYLISIVAALENIETVCGFVASIANKAGLNAERVHHFYLSTEEICTNIIEHGYVHPSGEIKVICRILTDRFMVTIIDQAPPFNPLQHADPDPLTPLNERRNGGWGIFFVKQYIEQITYGYAEGENRLTLTGWR